MAGFSAPTSTDDPDSNVRIVITERLSCSTVAGLNPANLTAVSPIPNVKSVLPGASSPIVDMLEAVTVGCRVTGFAKSGPIFILPVQLAAAARST